MESLLIYIFKSAGLISLFYILYILMLKNDTSFTANRKFLLGGVFTSIVLPSIYFTKKVLINAPEIVYSNSPQFSNFIVTPESTPEQLDWWMIAGTIYLIISGFFLLRFFLRIFQILKMIHFSKVQKEGKFKIVETQEPTGPFSFFNYLFINPFTIPEDEYLIMLRHEKVHANQFHSFDMLASHLLAAILWFNPISWYYKKAVEQNLEFIADHETAQTSECIQQYQHVLVKVTTNQYQNVLVNHFYQSFIKKRIVMLNKKKTSSRNGWKHQLVLPLLAIFIMSFNVKTTTKFIESKPLDLTESIIQNESLSVTITKTSTMENLEKFKSIFLKWNVELNFNNIEYSANENIITAIEVKFKNLKTGKTGVLIKDDSNGISPFEIYVNKNNITGFSDVTPEEHTKKTAILQLNEIGKNPIYFIDNKEYSTSDLDGKTISTKNSIDVLKPKDAIKRFGSKARDGVLIITDGKVIDDFNEELQRIDEVNKKESIHFIEIHKNEPPVFISLSSNLKSKNIMTTKKIVDSISSNNLSNKNSGKPIAVGANVNFYASDIDSIGNKAQIMNVKTKNGNRITWTESEPDTIAHKYRIIVRDSSNTSKRIKVISNVKNNKPLYIVNGEIEKDEAKVLNINPDNIENIYVLKDVSAMENYGAKGKNGVVRINTKNNKLFRIEATTSDAELEDLKRTVAATTDFRLNLNSLERNKKGLISKINIKFSANSGKMVSGNYSEVDGIPDIYFGEKEGGGVIIYSN